MAKTWFIRAQSEYVWSTIGKDTVLEGEHGEDQKHQVLPASIIVGPHVQNGEDEGADVVDANSLSMQVDNGGSLMGQQGNPEVLMRPPPSGRSGSCRGCRQMRGCHREEWRTTRQLRERTKHQSCSWDAVTASATMAARWVPGWRCGRTQPQGKPCRRAWLPECAGGLVFKDTNCSGSSSRRRLHGQDEGANCGCSKEGVHKRHA